MSYNIKHSHSLSNAAGKITVITTLMGVVIFALVFLLNVGTKEFATVVAQETATTSITVLNTPPQWVTLAYEQTESATNTPTNSGDIMAWEAIATDSNGADYQLLVCSDSATPTPGTSTTSPACDPGAVQWAVSATTSSGALVTAATTTVEGGSFTEKNDWYAWICDAIDLNARCNTTFSQGLSATNSSPFHMNSRPSFSLYSNDSPGNPGDTVTFTATTSDADVIDTPDTMQLVVCATSSFNGTTNTCAGTTLATSVLGASPLTATYVIATPTQDQDYTAFGYVIDVHGHQASGGAHGTDATLTVSNVAPTVNGAAISINNGNDINLTVAAGETTGFTLEFVATDANSCENASSGEEITDYVLSLYRSGTGSTTCDATTGSHQPTDCYVSTVPSVAWNLSCAATSTPNDCNYSNDGIDQTRTFSCSFPLWYVADPTDGGSQFAGQDWRAEVRSIDDDFATGTESESTSPVGLTSFLAFDLEELAIPYGELEPGNNTVTLAASTTLIATGNVGLDQTVQGESMCEDYTSGSPCNTSATSTIPESEQEFGTSAVAYGSGTSLSSTTPQEIELNINKPTATSTQTSGETFWGIEVPIAITKAGVYTGENTFFGVVAEAIDW